MYAAARFEYSVQRSSVSVASDGGKLEREIAEEYKVKASRKFPALNASFPFSLKLILDDLLNLQEY